MRAHVPARKHQVVVTIRKKYPHTLSATGTKRKQKTEPIQLVHVSVHLLNAKHVLLPRQYHTMPRAQTHAYSVSIQKRRAGLM